MRNFSALLVLLWTAVESKAQYHEVGLGYVHTHLPYSASSTWGAAAHYRYAWSGRWSVSLAAGHQRVTLKEKIELDRVKGLITFNESCTIFDLLVARRFFIQSPLRLNVGSGISLARLVANEGTVSISGTVIESKNFSTTTEVSAYFPVFVEAGLPIGERFLLAFRPVFRFVLKSPPDPLEFIIIVREVNFVQRFEKMYVAGPILTGGISLAYRIF
ncbi:MAG: hypothetical protein NZM43_03210 [Saprospiraceae bacterium]|nr:hypothetical protein [Saprospiraceae bacterium]MDW8483312.1 hypothetical protein [Saprospiraceae bacterium]